MKVGPTMGLNFNMGTGDYLKDYTVNGFGFLIGGKADMNFTPTIGMIANVNFYDGRSVSLTTGGTTYSFTIGYLEIEPLFKIDLPHNGLYFFAGPSFGINIQGSLSDGKNSSTLSDMNARVEIKGGAGMDFSVSRSMYISPELSFGYGLTKVQKDIDEKILTIQATVTCKFSIL
jgi:hypothetical protein